jgi:Antirestriction protein
MNFSIENESSAIVAREVEENERLQMLPRHFGRDMLTVEYAIFAFMRKLSAQYTGGYWTYYELSNRGFYMAPQSDSRFLVAVDTNDFTGEMSSDAAGITACLFALSHLSFQVRTDQIVEHFHLLRDFALEHAEASVILAAID